MLKRTVIILITTLTLTLNVSASSDGELILEKNNPAEIKECWEGFNKTTFAFNQGLDKIIFRPVASVYRKLPTTVKDGNNSLENLSNVVTIPNNIIQGFSKAGVNTGRFLINTTVGILGLIDVASYLGFEEYEKEKLRSIINSTALASLYIVLPVLGPSTARDAIASIANFAGEMLGTTLLLTMIQDILVTLIITPLKF